MKIRHFLLSVVVLLSLLGEGCAPARSRADYLSLGGSGEVRGKMSGMEFSAVVELFPGGESLRVEYLSPASLCGLVLVSDGKSCEVTVGELSFACHADEVSGFLRPVTAFLQGESAASVQREGENTVLTFPTGEVLTLSPSGAPISLMGEDMDLQVVWWEMGVKSEK